MAQDNKELYGAYRPLTHNEEIALRLVEAWASQEGNPAKFDYFLKHYDRALEHLEAKHE